MGKVVGILSMQRVLNYGSFLQAYALKQLLLQNGADDVYFIDIEKGRSLAGFEQENSLLKKLFRAIVLLVQGQLPAKIRDMKFMVKLAKSLKSQWPELSLDEINPNHFDVVFIGSDEVFNCCQKTTWGYTSQLYGHIPQADRIVSYAGSFGHTTFGLLKKLQVDGEIGQTMKENLSAISVRDQNSYDIVEHLTGIKSEIHLDPVLIYGYKDEIEARCMETCSPYMVIYSYQGRIGNKSEIKEIVTYARLKKLRLVSVFCRYDWCDEAVLPSTPFDVLAWFKGAECIVTDTFHGTIFSVITHRPFCSLIRSSNRQKLDFLLDQLGLCERKVLAGNQSMICSVLERPVDYIRVEQTLRSERERAMDYLLVQLDKV